MLYMHTYIDTYLFMYIYVFISVTGPHSAATTAFEVAMNFNLQKLVSAIADAPATVESGKLYRRLGGWPGHLPHEISNQ